ncbi:translation initiation factor eIF-2B epsilon subunit, GEF, partial [Coemansia furcata]
STPMKVNTTVVQSATSVCDALRNIDKASIITSDFILCTGLVVSNMNLSELVAAHIANKSHDRNQIMTMLLREAASTHGLFDKSDESVRLLAVNTFPSLPRAQNVDISTNAIIYKMPKTEPRAGLVGTDEDVYSPEVELRADLIDTHVSICSPEVLPLLTKNFDYQVIHRDFAHRTLSSDLSSSTIYAHILTGSSSVLSEAASSAAAAGSGIVSADSLTPSLGALDLSAGGGITFTSHSGYAAGVADTSVYDAISRDLIGRWAYPLCPDSNPTDGPPYSYHRGAVYKTPSVFLGRESRVDHHVILGPNSHNVVIERGCVIGDDVILGPNVRIAAFSRISRRAPQSAQELAKDDFDAYSYSGDSDEDNFDDSDSDSDDANIARNEEQPETSTSGQAGLPGSVGTEVFVTLTLGTSRVGYVWIDDAEVSSDVEDDIDDEEMDSRIRILRCIGSNLNDVEVANAEVAAKDSVDQHEWQPENAFVQEGSIDMAMTNIRSFRLTCNADQGRIRPVALEEALNAIDVAALPSSAKMTLGKMEQLSRWGINSGAEQVDAIDIIERHCAQSPAVNEDVRG